MVSAEQECVWALQNIEEQGMGNGSKSENEWSILVCENRLFYHKKTQKQNKASGIKRSGRRVLGWATDSLGVERPQLTQDDASKRVEAEGLLRLIRSFTWVETETQSADRSGESFICKRGESFDFTPEMRAVQVKKQWSERAEEEADRNRRERHRPSAGSGVVWWGDGADKVANCGAEQSMIWLEEA